MTKNLLTFFLFPTLIIVIFCGCEVKEKNIINTSEYNEIYEISEFINETQYDEYINDSGFLFDRLLVFKNKLTVSTEFDFFAFANNFIEIADIKIPDECTVNYGTEFMSDSKYEIDGESVTATESIQVSENFFSLFPLNISEGRGFVSSDFNYKKNEPIPVILGNAYRDSFNIGDNFEGYYICERKSFIVIGFTDSESDFYLRSKNCMTSYNYFIIMPFENIVENSYSDRAILLQQICGFIRPNNSIRSSQNKIHEYLKECNLENWNEFIYISNKSINKKMKD